MKDIINSLRNELSEDRFNHTISVMHTAECLAMCHGIDLEKAHLAGLLHDCAKCMDKEKMRDIITSFGMKITSFENKNPSLLHAKAGRVIAETTYMIKDIDILNAIMYHTTGRPNMSTLEKIVYIADFIEPQRSIAKNLPEARYLAFKDLDLCMENILKNTLEYLHRSGKDIDPLTLETYNYIILRR